MNNIDELPDKILLVKNKKQANDLTDEVMAYYDEMWKYLYDYERKQGREEIKAELRQLLDLQKAEE